VTPGPWEFVLLALGAFRVCRLLGWDEWPPVARLRAWVIGEHWVPGDPPEVERGKQPSSEVSELRPAYRRPMLAHLVHCPWCLGAYITFAVYGLWLAFPRATLYAMTPLAMSAAVGLTARNLDP
jgi:hypothetical protein